MEKAEVRKVEVKQEMATTILNDSNALIGCGIASIGIGIGVGIGLIATGLLKKKESGCIPQ